VLTLPLVPWAEFQRRLDWRQGEHVTLVGPTGCGKSTLQLALLERRRFVVFLASKPKDPILSKLSRIGFVKRTSWPPGPLDERVTYAPRLKNPEDVVTQRDGFRDAIADMYRQGGWCIVADELRYLTEYLRLGPLLELVWQQGRTLNLSLVAGAQRPARVPLSAFNQPTHLFLFRESDDRNLKRLSEIGTVNAREVRETVSNLGRYQFLHVNTRDGTLAVSRVNL
jgi:hypothetical protein